MISCLSSMATRALLAEAGADFEAAAAGRELAIESIGGVEAAKRVEAGTRPDLVVLAADAIDRLVAGGHLRAGSRVDLVRSPVAVAVRRGAPRPDIATPEALRAALAGATAIGYSTGPSGTHLQRLLNRFGLATRTVQAPPGVPVASLVARGEVDVGVQQWSELIMADGIDVVGLLPGDCAFVTTFAAARGTASAEATDFLDFLTSAAAEPAIRRHGMEPCR